MPTSLSIIGFGTFGQFIAPYLTKKFEVHVWNRTDYSEKAAQMQVNWCNLDEALQKDIIILATNISHFENFLQEYGSKFNATALVLDVASIKTKPVQLMQKYLPSTCSIIGTHPLFGPQSGKNGILGLNIVLCHVRGHFLSCVKDFLSQDLKLNVFELTSDQHDIQMAYIQGLTHFISRAITNMGIENPPCPTLAFQKLIEIKNLLGGDSYELFKSIENDNPYSEEVRLKFMAELDNLHKNLSL